ncbi:MAG: hypothetical protein ABI411_04580 [Tahibacter sp.]
MIPEQFKFGAPHLSARLLIVSGFAMMAGSQLSGSIMLFRSSFVRGALSLLVPGYFLVGLKRSGIYWTIIGPWSAGIAFIVIGTMLLS